MNTPRVSHCASTVLCAPSIDPCAVALAMILDALQRKSRILACGGARQYRDKREAFKASGRVERHTPDTPLFDLDRVDERK